VRLWSATAIAVVLTSGCESYIATDGRHFAKDPSHSIVDPFRQALEASAAHDLNCAVPALHITHAFVDHGAFVTDLGNYRWDQSTAPPFGVVQGCGQQAIYSVLDGRLLLESKSRLAASAP